ncbi:MAG: phenylalanine--tRNA ligase subunit beta [Desulfobulbaceae bacterium]|nr:phenylalanine--tRNA ligase subunit beta [Desulfobulbaceae bacterium]
MKITLKWLNEYVPLNGLTAEQIADGLTMLGLEVDAVVDMSSGLAGIKTARIATVRKHPDADRLTLCDVDTGTEVVQVVCGAPNAREGLVTAFVPPGVTLPGGLTIKQAKVRGQDSHGMLCSGKELGISEDHGGILEIDGEVRIGVELVEELGLDDTMVEIDLTPNRPDCASVLGIAREVGGFFGREVSRPVDPASLPVLDGGKTDVVVVIEEPGLCPRYAARKLTGVAIGPSPRWMQQRLLAVGMRPINNIVDITNYVMLETGQPLHAFDFNRIRGGKIIVRCPSVEEKTFATLDGNERTLDNDMLMICDGQGPVAVAGVMGGLESEVSPETTEILLESACFNPVSIRKTARKLNIPSEASYRFERGVDPDGAHIAMERAVRLMVEYAGAVADAGGVDVYPGQKNELVLSLRVQRVCDLLGIDISGSEIAAYLKSIDFGVQPEADGVLMVNVPSFRIDIEREVDLIEEIARMVGYNDIPTTMPQMTMDYPQRDRLRALRNQIAGIMTSRGFTEAINYSFTSENHLDLLNIPADDERRNLTRLLNPLTEEQSVMRTMLLPGLLENVRHNINRQKPDVSLFEIGKVFLQHGEGVLPEEPTKFCSVMTGQRYPESTPLYFSGLQADIFDLKGIAQTFIDTLGLTGDTGALTFQVPESDPQSYCHPEFSLHILNAGSQVGMLGKVAGSVLKEFGIKQDVYFLEMDLTILNGLKTVDKTFRHLPRYPWVKRDIALVVPEHVAAGELLQTVRELNVDNVENVELFDIYKGKPIEKGMKSVALSVTYRSPEQTLDDETVDILHDKIVNTLMSRFGGRYRE